MSRSFRYCFVERLWRSVKYEEVYLHAYEGVAAARAGLGRYFRFYNAERRHQGLGRRTPDEVYAGSGSCSYAHCSPEGGSRCSARRVMPDTGVSPPNTRK